MFQPEIMWNIDEFSLWISIHLSIHSMYYIPHSPHIWHWFSLIGPLPMAFHHTSTPAIKFETRAHSWKCQRQRTTEYWFFSKAFSTNRKSERNNWIVTSHFRIGWTKSICTGNQMKRRFQIHFNCDHQNFMRNFNSEYFYVYQWMCFYWHSVCLTISGTICIITVPQAINIKNQVMFQFAVRSEQSETAFCLSFEITMNLCRSIHMPNVWWALCFSISPYIYDHLMWTLPRASNGIP